MKRLIACIIAVVAIGAVLSAADKIDPRLATVRKAFIEPIDELSDDKAVAVCLVERLSKNTPMTVVAVKEDAEVVLRVKAHLPGGASRRILGNMGAAPSVDMIAQHADGTVLWKDGAKLRKANYSVTHEAVTDVPCGPADEISETLRDAMRKARAK